MDTTYARERKRGAMNIPDIMSLVDDLDNMDREVTDFEAEILDKVQQLLDRDGDFSVVPDGWQRVLKQMKDKYLP